MNLTVNGIDLIEAYRSGATFDEIKARVAAHGYTTHHKRADSGYYSDYYGTLWTDASRLVSLLDEANEKIAKLQAQQCVDSCAAAPDNFVIPVRIELYIGDKQIA